MDDELFAATEEQPPKSYKDSVKKKNLEKFTQNDANIYKQVQETKTKSYIDMCAIGVLIGCVVFIILVGIFELEDAEKSVEINSVAFDRTMDIVKYIAMTVMGYLFGKSIAEKRC
jgi:hypothetical protein